MTLFDITLEFVSNVVSFLVFYSVIISILIGPENLCLLIIGVLQ